MASLYMAPTAQSNTTSMYMGVPQPPRAASSVTTTSMYMSPGAQGGGGNGTTSCYFGVGGAPPPMLPSSGGSANVELSSTPSSGGGNDSGVTSAYFGVGGGAPSGGFSSSPAPRGSSTSCYLAPSGGATQSAYMPVTPGAYSIPTPGGSQSTEGPKPTIEEAIQRVEALLAWLKTGR